MSKNFFTLIATILIGGCSMTDGEKAVDNPFDGVPVIEISEPLDITDDTGSGSMPYYFSSNHFHHMMIDSRGHYFVYNRGSDPIYHFDENGNHIASIGKSGQGPGEFQFWPSFDTASSDTILALDRAAMVVSRFVYRNGGWGYDSGFTVQGKELYSPTKLFQIDRDYLIIKYSPDSSLLRDLSDGSPPVPKKLDLLNVSGELIQENWLTVPSNDRSVHIGSSGTMVTHLLPFGGRSIARVGPDQHIYHLWTTEFSIGIYGIEGTKLKELTHPNYHPTITDEMRRKSVDETVRVRMGSDREQQELLNQLYDEIPHTAPALRDFHVDRDTGYMLVRRYIFEEQPNWMLLDKDGNRIGVFSLDDNLNVFDFRNGKIIGAFIHEEGLPTVRIYSLPQTAL